MDTSLSLRHCSFCRSSEHYIRDCHCDEAVNLYEFLNTIVFNMPEPEQQNCLDNYTSREIKMISVILDLRIFSSKAQMIVNIMECLLEKKMRMQALITQQRNINGTNTIVINCIAQESIEEIDCPICLNSHTINNAFKTNCDHLFCMECLITHMKRDIHCKCPMCRTKLTILESKQQNPPNNILGEHVYQINRL